MCKWAHNFLSDLLLFWEYIPSSENISVDLHYKLPAGMWLTAPCHLATRSAEAVPSCVQRCDQDTCSAELSMRLNTVALHWRKNSCTETSVVICISVFGHHGKNMRWGRSFCCTPGSTNSLFANSKVTQCLVLHMKKTEMEKDGIIFRQLHT